MRLEGWLAQTKNQILYGPLKAREPQVSFKSVDPDKTGLTREVRQEDKVQQLKDGTVTLPTKKLLVVDLEQMIPDVRAYIKEQALGEIEFPLDFCPMDSGACTQGGELDGFYHVGGMDAEGTMSPELWIHSCYRPTRKWFTSHIKSVVKFYDGKVPW